MNLAVIGTSYQGLVSAACFAEMGNEVICVDNDEFKINELDQGRLPIFEPGLEDLLRRNCREGRLFFSTDLATAVQRSLICFICVDTSEPQENSAVSKVLGLARALARSIDGYKVIVNKSTVAVGTAAQVRQVMVEELKDRGVDCEIDVVSNPMFLKQGTAIEDFMKPTRIIIGCDNVRVAELLKELYAPFVRTNHPIIVMDVVSAELTKYAADAFLANKISFINEIANICALMGADVNMVRQGIGSDPRIGNLFLFPGLGYGGADFPKGVRALIDSANSKGYKATLLEAAEVVNQQQQNRFIETICRFFKDKVDQHTLALWGVSFKPGTDDIRGAPALTIINQLLERGARLKAFDPQAMNSARQYFGENPAISFAASMYEALEGAEALIINTEWTIFRNPNFERIKSFMKNPVIFDGRNLYNPAKMAQLGFEYYYIGQKYADN
jgi:UDPglucose 6-dehydrogenase